MAKHRPTNNQKGNTTWPRQHEVAGEIFSSSPSDDRSAQSMRVRHAAERLEQEIRALARTFTVAEFITLRGKIEDVFDGVLLSGRF